MDQAKENGVGTWFVGGSVILLTLGTGFGIYHFYLSPKAKILRALEVTRQKFNLPLELYDYKSTNRLFGETGVQVKLSNGQIVKLTNADYRVNVLTPMLEGPNKGVASRGITLFYVSSADELVAADL